MSEKFYISPGKSIRLARGVTGPGEEITVNDIPNPVPEKDKSFSEEEIRKIKQKSFDELVKKGIVTRTKPGKEIVTEEFNLRPGEEVVVEKKEPKKMTDGIKRKDK